MTGYSHTSILECVKLYQVIFQYDTNLVWGDTFDVCDFEIVGDLISSNICLKNGFFKSMFPAKC